MLRYETLFFFFFFGFGAPQPLALARPAIPPSPLSERVGYSDHVDFGAISVSLVFRPTTSLSTLQAMAVTGNHERLVARCSIALPLGRHLRRLKFNALARRNAHRTDMQISRIPASDKTSRLHPRRPRPSRVRGNLRARSTRRGARGIAPALA